jgi:lambda family phage minor tail protein L
MSFQTDIASDVQKAELGNIIFLYEIDLSDLGTDRGLFFTPVINDDYTPIDFNNRSYTPIEMEADGWEVSTGEQLPRPRIRVSNATLSFLGFVLTYDDLVGAKLIRRRTLAKYLDGAPEANPNAEFAQDIFVIHQKTQHTKRFIEFELAAYMDFEGIRIPKRQIIRDYCTHSYRVWDTAIMDWSYTSATCPYGNPNITRSAGGSYGGQYNYTNKGAYTTTTQDDKCGKRLSDCEARFSGNISYGTNPYIQATAPLTPSQGQYWFYTGVETLTVAGQQISPNIWYRYDAGVWKILKAELLPTRAFPGVSRFRR